MPEEEPFIQDENLYLIQSLEKVLAEKIAELKLLKETESGQMLLIARRILRDFRHALSDLRRAEKGYKPMYSANEWYEQTEAWKKVLGDSLDYKGLQI